MKYLPLDSFNAVTNALNFSTAEYHIIGGCDVYTTKAAGTDKKLYKNIDQSLETQYESLLRLSASLSPPYEPPSSFGKSGSSDAGDEKLAHSPNPVVMPDIDLSRSSPFGPLSQHSARRTFAYLIATLNASHPDYEFSNSLRPRDFKSERSLRGLMYKFDTTLQNLRPHKHTSPPTTQLAPLLNSQPVVNSLGNEIWNPKMWSIIDSEMDLKRCERYSYAPDDDPFDGEEGGIWSNHYFFFNKKRKRVCYLYLRGLSVISHSPVQLPVVAPVRTAGPEPAGRLSRPVPIPEPNKRISYWLGDKAGGACESAAQAEDDDDDEPRRQVGDSGHASVDSGIEDPIVLSDPGDDEVDVPHMDLDDVRTDLARGTYVVYDEESPYYYNAGGDDADFDESAYADEGWRPVGERPFVRGISEEIGESMEMDIE